MDISGEEPPFSIINAITYVQTGVEHRTRRELRLPLGLKIIRSLDFVEVFRRRSEKSLFFGNDQAGNDQQGPAIIRQIVVLPRLSGTCQPSHVVTTTPMICCDLSPFGACD